MTINPFAHIDTWIFDMDDVLYPKEIGFLKQAGDLFAEHIAADYGMAAEDVHKRLAELAAKHVDPWLAFKREMPEFNSQNWQNFVYENLDYSIIPACQETNDLLAQLPGQRAILTNAGDAHVERTLKRLEMAGLFAFISENVARNYSAKPDQSSYDHVTANLEFNPENALFVEDKAVNLEPAKTLGWTTVLVYTEKPAGADYIDHAYPDLLSFLKDAIA